MMQPNEMLGNQNTQLVLSINLEYFQAKNTSRKHAYIV